jgi:hypothetical protein
MTIRRLVLLLLPFTVSVLSADVTVRYKSELTMNLTLPGLPNPAKAVEGLLPQERTLLEKDGKALSSMNAGFTAITDFNTKEIILLDPGGKRFAKLDSARLGEALGKAVPEIPAAALLSSMKMNVSAPKLTGRTETIQGIEAEEQEMELSIDGPALPGMPPGPMIREVMQIWMAKQSEMLRVPAVRELTAYALYSMATTNPTAQLEALFKQIPGLSDAFASMQKNMQTGVLLRMHIAAYMPGLAQLMRPAQTNGASAGFDPNAPLMQLNQEMVEISSGSIAASQFEVPPGFQEVAAAELITDMLPKPPTPNAAVSAH